MYLSEMGNLKKTLLHLFAEFLNHTVAAAEVFCKTILKSTNIWQKFGGKELITYSLVIQYIPTFCMFLGTRSSTEAVYLFDLICTQSFIGRHDDRRKKVHT